MKHLLINGRTICRYGEEPTKVPSENLTTKDTEVTCKRCLGVMFRKHGRSQ